MTEAHHLFVEQEQQINAEIEQYENVLAELKAARESALKKEEGLKLYTSYLETLKNEYNLTEEDLFSRRSVQIGDWITTTLAKQRKSALISRLEKFMEERSRQMSRKKPLQGRSLPAKDLPPGVYRHPMTFETLEKKTRAPKALHHWVVEHGLDTVESWKIN
ncbi:MAG: hypothetical protein ACX931_13435 [Saccharospirillum sp.]